jgi:hypothetical protein
MLNQWYIHNVTTASRMASLHVSRVWPRVQPQHSFSCFSPLFVQSEVAVQNGELQQVKTERKTRGVCSFNKTLTAFKNLLTSLPMTTSNESLECLYLVILYPVSYIQHFGAQNVILEASNLRSKHILQEYKTYRNKLTNIFSKLTSKFV